jgi:hypothetical protein
MNLRSLDLNLLVVLDALLDEAHVSRAAESAFHSPPRPQRYNVVAISFAMNFWKEVAELCA